MLSRIVGETALPVAKYQLCRAWTGCAPELPLRRLPSLGRYRALTPIMLEFAAHAARGGRTRHINGFQSRARRAPAGRSCELELAFISETCASRGTETPLSQAATPRGSCCRPVAHGEGASPVPTHARGIDKRQVVFRYVDAACEPPPPATRTSPRAHRGIVNAGRNVLGMMPPPERAMHLLAPPRARLFESVRRGGGVSAATGDGWHDSIAPAVPRSLAAHRACAARSGSRSRDALIARHARRPDMTPN